MRSSRDLLFITVSHNVSFVGKTWWMLMLVLRLLLVLLAGFPLFSDEQEKFVCNTLQPGCSNVCFDFFAPVSVLRLWLVHVLLLCLPHLLFATYVLHRLFSSVGWSAAFPRDWSRGGSPSTLDTSSSSGEPSLHKAPLHDLRRERGTPRFYWAYVLAVLLRILLEVTFGAGQFFLFGSSVPKSFFCFEAPCSSGVECFISRPTEKTLMLDFMLGVASLSVLLSVVDLVSSLKAVARWRTDGNLLIEEISKGERSSVFTATTAADDTDVPSPTRTSPGGGSTLPVRDDKHAPAAGASNDELRHTKGNGRPSGSANEKSLESRDAKADVSRLPTSTSSPTPTHLVLHSHLRPPPSPRPDGPPPPPNPRTPTPSGVQRPGQCPSTGTNPSQQTDNSQSQDRRIWV